MTKSLSAETETKTKCSCWDSEVQTVYTLVGRVLSTMPSLVVFPWRVIVCERCDVCLFSFSCSKHHAARSVFVGVFFVQWARLIKKKERKKCRQLFSVFCFLLLFLRTKCSPLIKNRWLFSLTPVIHDPSCCCRWFWNLCNPGGHPVRVS